MNKLRLVSSLHQKSNTRVKIVSILSGKGGVGKSIVAANLAERLTAVGYRVLLVDADFSFGNIHILTNSENDYGVGLYASGRLSLREAVKQIIPSLDILASESNAETKKLYEVKNAAAFIKQLRSDGEGYDFIIVDHCSGKSEAATVMAFGSDMNLILIVPELTSLADGYGLFKHLIQTSSRVNCGLVVNRAVSAEEALYIHHKFEALTERFLKRTLSSLGYLPESPVVRQSLASQRFIAQIQEDSDVVQQLMKINQDLVRRLFPAGENEPRVVKRAINNNPALADIRE